MKELVINSKDDDTTFTLKRRDNTLLVVERLERGIVASRRILDENKLSEFLDSYMLD